LEAARLSEPDTASPFVSGSVVDRIVNEQLDLVRVGAKPVRRALRDAAAKINSQIQEALKEAPELRRKWLSAEDQAG
jgi:hypothetical protein